MLCGSIEYSAEADALADHEREGESREARVDLDHGAAREVEQPGRLEEAAAPDPVGDGVVDQRGPEKGEHDERRSRIRSAAAEVITASVTAANAS